MTGKKVKLETNHGDIIISLYDDMPVTAGNIEKLVSEAFYNEIIFHRIIDGFMIQVGCPQGTGTGGPGYTIKDEFVKGHSNVRGTVAMANTGQPDTGGSQFFVNLGDNSYLNWDNTSTPYKHPVFGEVTEGMDVVDKMAKLPTDASDRPKKEAKILKATII